MTSFVAIFCTFALALPLVLGASNGQRVQVTPKKEGTNETCKADMDPVFMKELLDGIRDTLFPKPLLCNGQDKLCRQMECCFYKNTHTPDTQNTQEGSTPTDDFNEAVVVNADRNNAQVAPTGACRLQTFWILIFGGLLLLVLLSFLICCCCLCFCRSSQKRMPHLSGQYRRPSQIRNSHY